MRYASDGFIPLHDSKPYYKNINVLHAMFCFWSDAYPSRGMESMCTNLAEKHCGRCVLIVKWFIPRPLTFDTSYMTRLRVSWLFWMLDLFLNMFYLKQVFALLGAKMMKSVWLEKPQCMLWACISCHMNQVDHKDFGTPIWPDIWVPGPRLKKF